nr:MAG TPA: hypothetical protein [Microviridae sp.]
MLLVKGLSLYLLQRYEFSLILPNNLVKSLLIIR